MVRLLLSLVATLTLALAAVPADAQAPAGAPRLDAAGDPLPPAAVARLGTLRFRPRNLSLVGLTPDGKSLLLEGAKRLHALDLQTGKLAPWGPADVAPGRSSRVTLLSGILLGRDRCLLTTSVPACAVSRPVRSRVRDAPAPSPPTPGRT